MGNFVSRSEMLRHYFTIRGVSLVLFTGGVLYIILSRTGRKSGRKRTNYPANIVILHQIERGPFAPSYVPFAVKLETYLRMANLPYMNVHSYEMSPKGKMPWIEYNGEIVSDSQFCIEFLNKKFDKDLNKHLSLENKAIGRAFQKMLEENTYWTMMLFRLNFDDDMKMMSLENMSRFLKWWSHRYYCRWNLRNAKAHGIGRHSKQEVHSIMMADLKALSDFLGKKKFLFGENPCETDCSIFGQLSQFYWHTFGNPPEIAIKEFTNLCQYCERMKETFWPDWNECITNGGAS